MKTILLTRGLQTLVDDDMFELLSEHKWYAFIGSKSKKFFYAVANVAGSKDRLHWYVVGKPLNANFVIDHINGDTLDNRRENLRIVTKRQNSWNFHTHRSGKLVGCHYYKRKKKWASQITVNGKKQHLGYFLTEQAAHKEYLEAVKSLGE